MPNFRSPQLLGTHFEYGKYDGFTGPPTASRHAPAQQRAGPAGGWHRLQQFNDFWVKDIPTGTVGVYVIHQFNVPLYVGRSRDIERRLLDHLAGRGNRYVAMAVKNNDYLTFTYLELASEHQAEKALIEALGGDVLPGVGPARLANLVSGSDPEDRRL